jgi:sugar/nucleoside kinase (ribokinase family)
MSLLVVGSVAYDVIELPGRQPVEVLGGSATWFSTAASMFSKPVIVAVIGTDFVEADLDFLKGRGVDTSFIARKEGATFRWHGRYHEDLIGRDSLRTELGVFAEFSPVIPPELLSPDVLCLGNIKPDLQRLVLSQTEAGSFVALDTIECWIELFKDDLTALMPSTDLLFLNDDEVRQLSGEHNLMKAARRILQMGARALVVKRGEHGAMLFDAKGLKLYPAFPVEAVVDPTGAGDCFAGGTLAYLDRIGQFDVESVRRALAVGTVMASFCVEGFGPRAFAEVRNSDFSARLAQYLEMTGMDADRIMSDIAE